MLSDPDSGGPDPQTEGYSAWWHRTTSCQIRISVAQILKPYDRVHGGTESHIVRSGWWRYKSSDPQTQGYGAWWHRTTYYQIRMVAAEILIYSHPGIYNSSAWWHRNTYFRIRGGGSTDPRLPKPKHLVHDGTRTTDLRFSRSGYQRHSFSSSNTGIECRWHITMLSDPDGGGLDPKILKHRDIVHGGTESCCQIRMVGA
jgi:hypothetical protein